MSYRPLLQVLLLSQILDIFAGMGNGRVPWTKLQKAPDDYIDPKYLPKDHKVVLKQYYHIQKKDANALLEHWISRQAAGEVPFRFRDMSKAIGKNNSTAGETDTDTEIGSGNEAEEDLQDDCDIQASGNETLQGNGGSDDGSNNGSNDGSDNGSDNSSNNSSNNSSDNSSDSSSDGGSGGSTEQAHSGQGLGNSAKISSKVSQLLRHVFGRC